MIGLRTLITLPSTKLPPILPIGSTLRWFHVLVLPVSSKLNSSTSSSCLGNTKVSPKYKEALLPNPIVGISNPIVTVPVNWVLIYIIVLFISVVFPEFNRPTAVCIPAAAQLILGLTIAGNPLIFPAVITFVIIFTNVPNVVASVLVALLPEVICVTFPSLGDIKVPTITFCATDFI